MYSCGFCLSVFVSEMGYRYYSTQYCSVRNPKQKLFATHFYIKWALCFWIVTSKLSVHHHHLFVQQFMIREQFQN